MPNREMPERLNALREDLSKEYYAILGIVSEYDGRLVVVKGWSVTLSLVASASGSNNSITPCSALERRARSPSGFSTS